MADEVSALDLLSSLDGEVVHVRIAGPVPKAVIDLHHLTVSAEANLHFGNCAIGGGIDRCSDTCRKVDAVMHLFYFVDRMYAQSETRCKRDQVLIGDRLNGGNGCVQLFFFLGQLHHFIL